MTRLLSLCLLLAACPPVAAAQNAPAAPAPTETVAASPPPAVASADVAAQIAALQINLNYVWTVIAAALVFFMQAGFAFVETGLTRAKNAANIMLKNFMDAAAGSLAYWLVGFGLMFGTPLLGGAVGSTGFMLGGLTAPEGYGDAWIYAFFFFQAVFAATSATIVSGAVAERTKFNAYFYFSIYMTVVVYSVFGAWAWGGLLNGGGWLEGMGFHDFAGSTVVHSIGGWAALAGAIVVGPRLGKYGPDGKPRFIKGHSLPQFGLGVFILWFGWFGFNAGSTTTGDASIALIAANTFLAGSAGAVAAMFTSYFRKGKVDVAVTLNGILGGLVGITAGCDVMTPGFAILTGLIAGVLLPFAADFIEKKVDDAVGAVAVHGVCGAWGTLAVALFQTDGFSLRTLGVQALGVGTAFVWSFTMSYLAFVVLKKTLGVRVADHHQEVGLDHSEHGAEAYPEFAGLVATAGDGSHHLEVAEM